MPEPDLIELFSQPLNQAGVQYFISGSVAAMLYGEPRVTHDIDFVVFLRSEDVPRLAAILRSARRRYFGGNGAGKTRSF